jgi:CRP-like cAMP-binding protein
MRHPRDGAGALAPAGNGHGTPVPAREPNGGPGDAVARFLRTVPCFEDLSPLGIAAVAHRVRWQSLPPRHIIFLEGEPCRNLHVLLEGRVECYRASAEGREQIVTMFDRPGDTFCIPSAFATGRNLLTARALVPTRLCLIDRETFVDVARQNPPMALRLVHAVSRDFKRVIDLAESLALCTARVRVARLLYERALTEGVRTDRGTELARARLREDEIASRVGTVRVHVSRSLRSLARAGTIVVDRALIRIPDLGVLERLAQGHADGAFRNRPLARALPPRRAVTFVTDSRAVHA